MKHTKCGLFLLTFVLLIALTATGAFAALEQRGECGNGVKWVLSEAGILTISPDTTASGPYEITDPATYINYVNEIKGVVIDEAVTSICDRAFVGLTSMRAVVMKGVKTIGSEAFRGCTALEAISVSSALETLGEKAFYGCSSFGLALDLSKTSLKDIPADAFRNCTYLRDVKFPTALETIGSGAFYGCTILTNVTMPATLVSIGENAFANTDRLGVADFSETTVTKIDKGAFTGSEGLTTVWLPTTVTSIEDNAFYGCWNLEEINVKEEDAEAPATQEEPIADASDVAVISDLRGITSIGKNAFRNCRSLAAVFLSDALTTIEDGAFRDCFKLSEINLPANLTKIGADAFSGTAKLQKFATKADMERTPEQRALAAEKETAIVDLRKEARGGGKATAQALEKAIAAVNAAATSKAVTDAKTEGVEAIKLAKRTDPSDITALLGDLLGGTTVAPDVLALPAGYTQIDDYAFRGMNGLTNFNLPATVTSIGKYAVADCTMLDYIGLPAGLNSLGEGAFSGDSFASNLVFADGIALQTIAPNAFNGCSSLSSVILPLRTTTIGAKAFYGCKSMYALTMPESVTKIGEAAFWGCDALQYVIYLGTHEQWNTLMTNNPENVGGYNSALLTAEKRFPNDKLPTDEEEVDMNALASFVRRVKNTFTNFFTRLKNTLLNIITGKGVGDFFYQRPKNY